MNPPAVHIADLRKSYEDTVALRGVNLTIEDGEFYGLLGPNGAGKTTTIHILTGLVLRNEGTTQIYGKDTVNDFRFTRSQLGIAHQELPVDWFFPIEKLLKALVHDPKVIILDEPTAGVDVELRHELWDYLRELHQQGKTILLTTHYIEEAELLCEKVGIIDRGKIIKEGSPKELTSELGKAGINVQLTGWTDELKDDLSEFSYTKDDGRLHFSVRDPEEAMARIIQILSNKGCHIQSVSTERSSLEDVFLNLTGKGIN